LDLVESRLHRLQPVVDVVELLVQGGEEMTFDPAQDPLEEALHGW
jgi:hypothetical protein